MHLKYLVSGITLVLVSAGLLVFTRSEDPVAVRDMAEASATGPIVYETDADSAADCALMEKFDAERRVCTFECTDEATCTQYESYINDEFSYLSDEYTKDGGTKVREAAPKSGWSDDADATFTVAPDESITLDSGADKPVYHEIWDKIAALSPDDFSKRYIEEYAVFNRPSDDTLAYAADEDNNGKWTIAVNVAGYDMSSERERTITFVHELSHILTLNTSQVTPGDASACSGFFTGEGCALALSYIGKFVSAFWQAAEISEVGGGMGEGDSKLYERKSGSFVTEYAATNPGEDIAESFALFVVNPKNDHPASVADQKTQFFYRFPELVSFRDSMRTAITRDIVRARRAVQQ